MRRGPLLILLPLFLLPAASSRAKGPKPQPCPGGRYLVTGSALVTGDSTGAIEPVVIGSEISIGNACNPVHAKLKATKRGTTVLAVWPSCQGLTGKVKLTGRLDPTCVSLAGTLIAKKSHVKQPFVAQATRCGDGIVDPGNAEQCDGDACPGGAECRGDCTCAGLPPPTTTTTTTATTTSSAPVTTSSTTTSSSMSTSTSTSTTSTSSSTVPTTTSSTTSSSTEPTTTTTSSSTSSSSPSTTTSTSSSSTTTSSSTSTTTATTSSTTSTTFGPCTQDTTHTPFVVSFAVPDSSVLVQGLTVLIDYPETQVTIPGSGNAITVRQTLINVQPGALSQPFDLDDSLREQLAGTASPLTPGNIFTINFFNCVGTPPPTPADFTCTVQAATDPLGLADDGVTCTVSAQ